MLSLGRTQSKVMIGHASDTHARLSETEFPQHCRRESVEQFRWRHTKPARQLQHDREARHLIAAFELADVRRREVGRVGEVFLRPGSGDAQPSNGLAEDLAVARLGHSCVVTTVTVSLSSNSCYYSRATVVRWRGES